MGSARSVRPPGDGGGAPGRPSRARIAAARGVASIALAWCPASAVAAGPVIAPAAASAAASPLLAQGSASFDPARDLEGFEQRYGSEFRDLYRADAYTDRLGQELSPEKLAELRAAWAIDRARGDEQAAALRADPPRMQLWRLERRLAVERGFDRLAFEAVAGDAAFPVYVQKTPQSIDGDAERIAGELRPWIAALGRAFDAQVARPFALVRDAARPALPIVVFRTPADLRIARGQHAGAGYYDFELGAVLHALDPTTQLAPHEQRYVVLAKVALGLLDAHRAGTEPRWTPWLRSGFADWLAWSTRDDPASLERREVVRDQLATLVRAALDADRRELLLAPIEDLVALRDLEPLYAAARKRAGELRVTEPTRSEIDQCFRAQVALAWHFLNGPSSSGRREAFGRWLRDRLAGQGDLEAFRAGWTLAARAELDPAFWEWAFAEHERAFPGRVLDRGPLASLFAARRADLAAAAPAPAPAPAWDPSALALDPLDPVVVRALAVLDARRGDLAAARARIEAARAAGVGDAGLAAELARLAELAKLRDAWLESLRASGAKWTLERGGKKTVVSVRAVESGDVVFAENRAGLARMPLAELDPLEVARQADKKDEQGSAAPWARVYAFALAGDERARKDARDDSPELRALREDARELYPRLVRTGEAAALLQELAGAPAPATREEALARVETIGRLASTYGPVDLVRDREAALRALAATALATAASEADVASALGAAVEDLGGGRLRLTYDFAAAREGEDFVPAGTQLASAFSHLPKIALAPSLAVEEGALVALGSAGWRHKLAFSSPLRVAVDYRFELGEGRDDVVQPWFHLAICAEGKEASVQASADGDILVRDPKSSYAKQSFGNDATIYLETAYSLEVVHDGQKITTSVDATPQREASCGPRVAGALLLLVHAETPVRFERVVIEGAPTASSLAELRGAWVERRLAELGFR